MVTVSEPLGARENLFFSLPPSSRAPSLLSSSSRSHTDMKENRREDEREERRREDERQIKMKRDTTEEREEERDLTEVRQPSHRGH